MKKQMVLRMRGVFCCCCFKIHKDVSGDEEVMKSVTNWVVLDFSDFKTGVKISSFLMLLQSFVSSRCVNQSILS